MNASLDGNKIIPLLIFSATLGLAVLTAHDFNVSSSHGRSNVRMHEPMESENVGLQEIRNYLMLRDPATGEIPRGIHARELAYARTLHQSFAAYKGSPTIHTTGWNSIGPNNTGGRTQAIGIDTMNQAIVLIATAQGGVFRSTDSGASWRRTTAPGELKDMSSLVQDHRPGKTNTWYAGTGELISTTWRRTAVYTEPDWHSATLGNGIYKSTDDGMSWSVLPSTVSPNATVLDSAFDGVWDVVVDNSRRDSDIVYAAGFGAILRSNDGGGTWSRVLGERAHASFATDVAVTSSGVIYAYLSGTSADGVTSSTAGVWRSRDGFHWTSIAPPTWSSTTGRMRFAIAPSDENVVYLGGVDPNVWYGTALFKYDYFSGNGSGSGGEWFDRSQIVPQPNDSLGSDAINTYGGYAVTLAVYPTDTDLVFFGGTNLYRSWDGFATLDKVEWIGGYDPFNGRYGEPNNDHPDHHAIAFLPSNPTKVLNANDGGMFMTYNVLGYDDPTFPVTWQSINYDDPASIIYDVALDHASRGDTAVLGGFQDQGSWLYYDTGSWIQYWGGDGCYCAIADNKSAYYMSSQNGYVSRWKIGSDFSYQGYAGITPTQAQDAQFVTPWMLDPTNSDQMYLASNNTLWRNNDLAGIPDNQEYTSDINWEQLTNCTTPLASNISALGMSQFSAHRLYYGTSDGHLYRVDNADGASPTPQEITDSIFPKKAFICCVAVDPQNADSIVVCFSNYHIISIFASNDGGTTWHAASGNLEQNADGSGDGPSVRWVSIIHQQGETLYLCGTSVGLFSTTDISGPNVSWVPEGTNTIGYAIVETIDARQSDGFVAIATQGSGVYTAHVAASPSVVSANPRVPFTFTVSPDPARASVHISLGSAAEVGTTLFVCDLTGKSILPATQFPQGQEEYSLDCTRLPEGTYFIRLEHGNAIETRRLVIVR